MRNVLPILILLFSNFLFSQSKPHEENQDNYICQIISDLKKENQVTDNPVIVINEKVYKERSWDTIRLSRFDIETLSIIHKHQNDLIEVYGEQSKNGVILIETKPFQEKIEGDFEVDSNVLFLVNEKELSKSKAQKINPDSIEHIKIIKTQDSILKYTSKNVQGIIKITLKQ